MTKAEYNRYTGTAYMSMFTTTTAALRFALNAHNICKTKIIMLGNGIYGVAQNSLANKFFAAGYEQYNYGLEAYAVVQ